MKVAIPAWEDRVSSVFEFSQRVVIVELHGTGEISRTDVVLSELNGLARLAGLRALGVDVVICGAISRPIAPAAEACGIQLLPYVMGRVDEVLDAFQAGQLAQPQFALPGWLPAARKGCEIDVNRAATAIFGNLEEHSHHY